MLPERIGHLGSCSDRSAGAAGRRQGAAHHPRTGPPHRRRLSRLALRRTLFKASGTVRPGPAVSYAPFLRAWGLSFRRDRFAPAGAQATPVRAPRRDVPGPTSESPPSVQGPRRAPLAACLEQAVQCRQIDRATPPPRRFGGGPTGAISARSFGHVFGGHRFAGSMASRSLGRASRTAPPLRPDRNPAQPPIAGAALFQWRGKEHPRRSQGSRLPPDRLSEATGGRPRRNQPPAPDASLPGRWRGLSPRTPFRRHIRRARCWRPRAGPSLRGSPSCRC